MAPVAAGVPPSQSFTPFEIAWDAPQLSEGELARSSSFEWWYFDFQTDDGVEMVILFSRRNPVFSPSKASIYVEYKDSRASLKHVRNYARSEFSCRESDGGRVIRIAGNTLSIRGAEPASMTYEITLDLPWITATLALTPLHRGFLPSADGSYFTNRADPSLRSCVSFSAPMMRVKGSVQVDGNTRAVSGRGYHDHPWGTVQLFDTHQEWNWARLTSPSASIMFADVRPAAEYSGTLSFLFLGTPGTFEPQLSDHLTVAGSAWQRATWHGLAFPHSLAFQTPTQAWNAEYTSSLLDVPIYNRSQVSWGPSGSGTTGTGWVEYYRMIPSLRKLVFIGARVACFFLRPFPFFGR